MYTIYINLVGMPYTTTTRPNPTASTLMRIKWRGITILFTTTNTEQQQQHCRNSRAYFIYEKKKHFNNKQNSLKYIPRPHCTERAELAPYASVHFYHYHHHHQRHPNHQHHTTLNIISIFVLNKITSACVRGGVVSFQHNV